MDPFSMERQRKSEVEIFAPERGFAGTFSRHCRIFTENFKRIDNNLQEIYLTRFDSYAIIRKCAGKFSASFAINLA